MEFTKGMKVKINPIIATKEYLINCYFDVSALKKLKEIAKGTEYTILGTNIVHTTKDGKEHKCITLMDFGWIPEEAIICDIFNLFKTGYAFKTKNGNTYLCAEDKGLNLKNFYAKESYKNYNLDGTHKFNPSFDIIGIYYIGCPDSIEGIFNSTPIWEPKKPKKEMTIAEIEQILGYGIKIVKEEEY